jgi:hypothetical protein
MRGIREKYGALGVSPKFKGLDNCWVNAQNYRLKRLREKWQTNSNYQLGDGNQGIQMQKLENILGGE